ncbi:SEC-C metal-binding domain-containing protein [Halomonas borealis]|uniref:SEC-C metal-binding domain-containing protein n=1 Tax=Halomonas borealis TaxID=2508710 RepID=UPI00109FC1A1
MNEQSTTREIAASESSCTDTSCCPPKSPTVRSTPKVGRNDPCICGNGKKFKKCCGKNL